MDRVTVLVTGSQGKVGRHVVAALERRNVKVVGVDIVRGVYDTWLAGSGFPEVYMQADLQDAGAVYSCVARFKPAAVIHTAAIPDPTHNPPHTVFATNVVSTFNVVEACVRLGVPRLVNVSSETVPGAFFPERVHDGVGGVSGEFQYAPVDERHPVLPQDPYALSKSFGEQLCDAAVRRADTISVVSVRPSWCQDAGNVERNLGPLVRDAGAPNAGLLAYVVIADLAEAICLAALAAPQLRGHEVVYVAADDSAGGHDLAAWIARHYGSRVPVRTPLARADASALDCAKAKRLLGWAPRLSWRDFLGPDGKLLPTAPGKP